jgi:SAM-dependent methyltransferase
VVPLEAPVPTSSTGDGWTCNICSSPSAVPLAEVSREVSSCPGCGSTLRWRAVVAALSINLFGRSLTLDTFPLSPRLKGVGMSDWEGYGDRLARRMGYTNTFLHKEPVLDITEPVPADLAGACDFVISSEVLEHVDPPWQRSLEHLHQLLVPGGLLVLTVPYKLEGPTEEHFPELHEYKVVELGSRRVLLNRTRAGVLQVYDDPVFHDAAGSTLEMRLFAVGDLLAGLEAAGFSARVWDDPTPQHGIVWNEPWSIPIVARRSAAQSES